MKKISGIISAILVLICGWVFMNITGNEVEEAPTAPAQVEELQTETSPELPAEAVSNPEEAELGTHTIEGPDGVIKEFKVLFNYTKDGSYQRSDFGKPWADTDKNGCDTRNDILMRDLTNITVNEKCQVLTGVLANDPYTSHSIDFVRGEKACDKTGWNGAPVVYNGQPGGCSTAVTIDHVVSLEEVWYLSAKNWDYEKRVQFANDPINLYATGANSWKNAKTPTEILNDPNSPMDSAGICNYINTYIEVIEKYELPVSPENARTLSEQYISCNLV